MVRALTLADRLAEFPDAAYLNIACRTCPKEERHSRRELGRFFGWDATLSYLLKTLTKDCGRSCHAYIVELERADGSTQA